MLHRNICVNLYCMKDKINTIYHSIYHKLNTFQALNTVRSNISSGMCWECWTSGETTVFVILETKKSETLYKMWKIFSNHLENEAVQSHNIRGCSQNIQQWVMHSFPTKMEKCMRKVRLDISTLFFKCEPYHLTLHALVYLSARLKNMF